MKKPQLLYIGNQLSKHGFNKTSIETLGVFLQQDFELTYSSSKKNQIVRLLDMCLAVFRNSRKAEYVIIDTYSTSSFWYAFVVSQLCRLLKMRYVPVLRGGDLPNRLAKNPVLSRLLFKNAYKNVAPSNFLFTHFASFGLDNVVFIPNNLELENYPFIERTPVQPRLLWVRAFASIYNPKMAIDVLSELKKNFPQAALCMVGPDKDGSMKTTREYATENECQVLFTGGLPKEKWIELSGNYDFFINTTHFDNTPVSVMEAMALGLPVISTNVGGIPYLLEDQKDAILVNDNDSTGMAQAVLHLMQNQEAAENLAKNARRKAENWDWTIVRKQWQDLLK